MSKVSDKLIGYQLYKKINLTLAVLSRRVVDTWHRMGLESIQKEFN